MQSGTRNPSVVARTSEPSSVAQAYREYSHQVAWWASRLGGPEVDTEDIVQEVFLVVNRRFDGFRRESSFATWLFGITRKVVANHLRRLRVRSSERNPSAATLSPVNPTPDAELERRQAAQLFYEALDRLAEKYRTVLVLFEVEGMSVQEISDLCHAKLSTVKVQLARARKKFIKHYQELLRHERKAGRYLRLYEMSHRTPDDRSGADARREST
jgi:RNA polymerase sigma-70 factor, ECF subfamily